MDTADLAYMAGIMDGEGCIHIGREQHSDRLIPCYWLEIMIGITDRYICRLFHGNFGGTVRNIGEATETHYAKWMWRISGNKASDMLQLLLPYLRLKHSQAELALKFQSHRKYWGNKGKPEEELKLDESEYTLMRNLKKEKLG